MYFAWMGNRNTASEMQCQQLPVALSMTHPKQCRNREKKWIPRRSKFSLCGPLLSDHSTSPFHANNLKISPCQYQLSKAQSTGYCNVENVTVRSTRCKCSGPLTPITYCTIEKTCLIMASLDWWRLIASSSFDIGRDSVLMILKHGGS